jgi:hypothetical protein
VRGLVRREALEDLRAGVLDQLGRRARRRRHTGLGADESEIVKSKPRNHSVMSSCVLGLHEPMRS